LTRLQKLNSKNMKDRKYQTKTLLQIKLHISKTKNIKFVSVTKVLFI